MRHLQPLQLLAGMAKLIYQLRHFSESSSAVVHLSYILRNTSRASSFSSFFFLHLPSSSLSAAPGMVPTVVFTVKNY